MTIIGEAFVRVSPEGAGFAQKLQAQLKTAGLGNAGLLAGAAIAGGIVVGLSAIGSEFGKVRRIITQETGASAKEIDGLFASVRRTVKEVPVSLEAAAKATDLLFKRGVPIGPQLDKLAKQELFLAKITKEDLGATVEQTTSIFAKFNVPLREQSRELDVLFKASQKSGKSLGELLAPLQTGGAALQEFGFSLDKSAALITNLQIAGVNVQPALAALRKAFGQLAKDGKDPTTALADLVAEFKSGQHPAVAMADAMKLFGSRAGLELARAIKAGKFEVDDLLKIITNGKDGIIATGEATLTLSDRFTLLRNRVIDNFAEIGIAVRNGLSTIVVEASEPLARVGAAFAHLLAAAAPVAVIFAPIALALRGVLPGLGAFATGLEGIAAALRLLHNPAIFIATAIVVLGTNFLAIISIINQAAVAVKAFTLTLLSNPYVAAAAAIVGLGIAIQVFRDRVDPAIAIAKTFSDAMFTTDDAATIFANGMHDATDALNDFFTAQARSSKTNFVKAILAGTGSTVDQLTSAVTGSRKAFDAYEKSAVRALESTGASGLVVAGLTEQIQGLRDAYALTATAQANAAINTGVLTRTQKNALIEQNRFADGSVNLAGFLDDLNAVLAKSVDSHNDLILAQESTAQTTRELEKQFAAGEISATDFASGIAGLGLEGDAATEQLNKAKAAAAIFTAELDKAALPAIETSKAYGLLATGIATGSISQVDATTTLEAMGLSATGAAAAFTDLQGQIKTFVDGALAALPTVADAVRKFQSDLTSDQGNLANDIAKQADLQKQLADAGGKASDSLRAAIHENNLAIIADNKKLAEDTSPQAFTKNLLDNAKQITLFNHNIRVLVGQGLGALAGDLAQLGPEQAGALAASLASNPSQAKVANSASQLAASATDSYKKTLEEKIGPLALTGEAAGKAVGAGIAKGIIAELLKEIPALKDFGIGAGETVTDGAVAGVDGSKITGTMQSQIGLHAPEFRGLGIPIGKNVGEGAKEGAGSVDVTAGIESAIRRGGGKVRAAGTDLGNEAIAGITSGILAGFKPVGDAVLAVTQHGVAIARGAWRITSPSKVFAEIGSQVGAGLVQGITGSAADVGDAARLMATNATTSVEDALNDSAFAAQFNPKIVATVAPITLPPIPPVNVEVGPLVIPDPATVIVPAAFGPLVVPPLPDQVITASVLPTVPPIDPVVINASLGPIPSPVVPSVVVPAALEHLDAPRFDPVVFAASLSPIPQPTFDPVTITPIVPDIPPVTVPANLGPLVVPPLPEQTVKASVVPTVHPIDPVTISATLGAVRAPRFDPIVFQTEFAPIKPPTFDPVVIDASLSQIPPPEIPPVVAPVTLPNFAPVVVRASLAPFAPPVVPPLKAELAPLAAPVVPPVVVPATLAALPTPTVDPIIATFAPLVAPKIDPQTIQAHFGPVDPPVLQPITPTLVPVSARAADSAFSALSTSADRAGSLAVQGLAADVNALLQLSGESINEWKRRLAQLFVQGSGETISEWHRRLAAEFGKSFRQMVNDSEELRRFLLVLGGTKVAPVLDLTKFDAAIQQATAGQRFREWIRRLNELVPRGTGQTINEWKRSIDQFFVQGSGETISEWHRRLRELVGDFHKSFGQIGDDADELRRFLAALGGTKFAPIQPPSALTISQAAQSVPVARPEDRANAERQQDAARRSEGVFAGAVVQFPEKADPLHIAAEIAWRLL